MLTWFQSPQREWTDKSPMLAALPHALEFVGVKDGSESYQCLSFTLPVGTSGSLTLDA
jgi:hypothetical protein